MPRVQRSAVIGGGSGSGSATRMLGGSHYAGESAPIIPPIEPPPEGCTVIATSLDYDEVNAKVQACPPLGTVCLPVGTVDWAAGKAPLILDKQIILRGAGKDLTTIRDLGVGQIIQVNTTPGAPIRVCHIGFIGGTVDFIDATNYRQNDVNCIMATGQGQVRIDHCRFDCRPIAPNRPPGGGLYSQAIVQVRAFSTKDGVTGVFDNNLCIGGGGLRAAVNTDHNEWGPDATSKGDASWALPTGWGLTTSAFYYERNTFQLDTSTGVYSGAVPTNMFAHDSHKGGRLVFRYNTLINSNIAAHGSESGGRFRGTRMMEVYENDAPNRTEGVSVFCDVRSGTIRIWNNRIGTDYTGLCRLDNNRSTQDYGTWESADGRFPFDLNDTTGGPLNDGVYESGIAQVGSGSGLLVDPSKNFSTTDWVGGGYSLRNTSTVQTTNDGRAEGSFIIAQGPTTLTTQPGVSASGPIFNVGDSYQIRRCQRPMDCCGLGQGDLLINDVPVLAATGLPGWPHQQNDPCYSWGNFLEGASNNTMTTPVFPHIKPGRDFFNGVNPGYTPAVEPHPLRTSGFTAGS